MGIKGIEKLMGVPREKHKFVDWPVGNIYHGKTCVQCGRVKDSWIHNVENEEAK